MNINATEDDLIAAADALKLAAILDDRVTKADKARIAAWAEKLHRHGLIRGDVLDGLQAFYDGPSERAIQIGDLIHHSRLARRARNEAEEDAELDARAASREAMAADDIQTVTAAAIMGRVKDTPRLKAARDALQNCRDRAEAMAAIREFGAAKAEAGKR